MAANGRSEAAEGDVRRYFGSGKGTAIGIRQALRGRGGVAEYDSGSEGYLYAGTEIGDARVGE